MKQGRAHVKRYGCIFTGLNMRAVHIEISHSLSTDSFLGAFYRFVALCGAPKELYSDNGTNFVGAQEDIHNSLARWDQNRIHDNLLKRETNWHFNPPNASHTGGSWERMIRSVCSILRQLLGEQLVDDETLSTLMCETEKILNDRPLTKHSDDLSGFGTLTPNDLLLRKRNPALPPHDFSERTSFGSCWRQAHYLADIFWQRWLKEYLPQLQLRQKWIQEQPNVEVGDLVLLSSEKKPRGQWPKAIVEQTFPDEKGYVREVIVRTAKSCYRRDIRKLCLLEKHLDELTGSKTLNDVPAETEELC